MIAFLSSSLQIQTVNATTYKWYDVTDYETIERMMEARGRLSPLIMIQSMHKDALGSPAIKRMLKPGEGLFGEWLSYKKRTYTLPPVLWALLRLSNIILFLIYESDIKWVKQVGGVPQSVYDSPLWNRTGNTTPAPFPICDKFVATDMPIEVLNTMRWVLTGSAAFSFCKEVTDFISLAVLSQTLFFVFQGPDNLIL